jgi:hypothetical protein
MTYRTALFSRKTPGGVWSIEDQSLSTGARYFVGSGVTGATDATTHGDSPDHPFATIDYAVGRCTASQGDIIYVMPGHVETVASAAALDFDVAGIKVVGLGWGDTRPIVSIGTATSATVEFNADDMWIENIRFKGAIADLVVGLDIKTGCDDLTFKNCEIGGTSSAVDMLIGVTIEATNDRITFDGCYFKEPAGGEATAAIKTEGAFSNLLIKNCVFWGDWKTATLDLDAAAVTADGLLMIDCDVYNADASAGLFCTLADTTVAHFVRVTTGLGKSNTPPIPTGDDGATTAIECYATEAGSTYGVIWPLTATNFGA